MRTALVILVLIGAVSGGVAYLVMLKPVANSAMSLRTAMVHRGDLLSTVKATGTVEAEEVVNVGTRLPD